MSVDVFNKLPRRPRAPSGLVPNVWHFDLRYIQIQPPSHMLFLLQPESSYVHTELLPIGRPHHLGFAFFPDTAKEAAPEIAKGLIHAFVTGMGISKFERNPPPAYAPWAFTTDDRNLAKEVGAELKRLGVKAPELCEVKFVPKLTNDAHTAFSEVFRTMKMALRNGAIFTAPSGISFTYFKLAPWVERKTDEDEAAIAYCERLSRARPLFKDIDTGNFMKEIEVAMEVLRRRRSATVLSEADGGDPQAAIEYSLRLQFGIQCTPSRALCRQYLIKVITNDRADDVMKSVAHSLLIDWYVQGVFEDNSAPARYVHAAAHSADEAVRLASDTCKHSGGAPRAIHACLASEAQRELELDVADRKATQKRMKQPNRYMCANVGCPVASDSGHMLRRCSGQCDQDKKPSYCGKDCRAERADWKNHKPFCKPGAPCSVIERPEVKVKGQSLAKGGALEVPIKNPDGTTTIFSSSSMSPKMLKEMKAYAEAPEGPISGSGFGSCRGITVSMGRYKVGDGDDSSESDSDID